MRLYEIASKSGSIIDNMGEQPRFFDGHFDCQYQELKSLVGAPSHVTGDMNAFRNKLITLEGSPSRIDGSFIVFGNKLTSLKDVHKHVKFIGGIFRATNNPIKSNILGLLLIDGVKQVQLDSKTCARTINKYLGKGKRGVFDAQQELIEAGFPEMAKL